MNLFSTNITENSPKRCRVTGYDGFTRSKMVEIFSKGVLENPSPSVTRHQSGVILGEAKRELLEAPTIMSDVSSELTGLLAAYRAAGAVLTLERVTSDGGRTMALGVELSTTVAPSDADELFAEIERDGLDLVHALELEADPVIESGEVLLEFVSTRGLKLRNQKELII